MRANLRRKVGANWQEGSWLFQQALWPTQLVLLFLKSDRVSRIFRYSICEINALNLGFHTVPGSFCAPYESSSWARLAVAWVPGALVGELTPARVEPQLEVLQLMCGAAVVGSSNNSRCRVSWSSLPQNTRTPSSSAKASTTPQPETK